MYRESWDYYEFVCSGDGTCPQCHTATKAWEVHACAKPTFEGGSHPVKPHPHAWEIRDCAQSAEGIPVTSVGLFVTAREAMDLIAVRRERFWQVRKVDQVVVQERRAFA